MTMTEAELIENLAARNAVDHRVTQDLLRELLVQFAAFSATLGKFIALIEKLENADTVGETE